MCVVDKEKSKCRSDLVDLHFHVSIYHILRFYNSMNNFLLERTLV